MRPFFVAVEICRALNSTFVVLHIIIEGSPTGTIGDVEMEVQLNADITANPLNEGRDGRRLAVQYFQITLSEIEYDLSRKGTMSWGKSVVLRCKAG